MKQLISYFKSLNIYIKSNGNSNETEHDEIIATRVFLLLFCISLTGLVGYSSLTLQLKRFQVDYPSQSTFEYLQSMYSETLVCPCSSTSIQFSKLASIQIEYHQICSSEFIDTDWISSISNEIPQIYYSLDIRRMLSSQLQLLSAFCQASKTNLNSTLTILSSTHLLIPTMLSFDNIYSKIDALINQEIESLRNSMVQDQTLILSIHEQDQLVSALQSNYLYGRTYDDNQVYSFVRFLENQNYPPELTDPLYTTAELCECGRISGCVYPSGIYPNLTGIDSYRYYVAIVPETISLIQIPGLYVGCTAANSLLKSNLQCFYNYQCLISLFNRTDIKPLNNNGQSNNYSFDTSIETLVNQLFIENIKKDYFNSLFEQCKPKTCTYSYNAKGTFMFIFLTVISLISGISVVSKFAALYLVKFSKIIHKQILEHIFKISNSNEESRQINNKNRIKSLLITIRRFLIQLNLFEDSFIEENQRFDGIISTRIYILSMLLSITVITFYASIIEHTLTYRIQSPTINQYYDLFAKYPNLQCECQQISIPYSKFITFQPEYHPVCSSVFVSDSPVLSTPRNTNLYLLQDFSPTVFQAMVHATGNIGCIIAPERVSYAISTYLETIYVNRYLLDTDQFQIQTQSSINSFKSFAPTLLIHLLQLLLDTTQGNYLLTASLSNAHLIVNSSSTNIQDTIDMRWEFLFNHSCQCSLSSDSCAILDYDYCNHTSHPTFEIGAACRTLVVGYSLACDPVTSILSSTLQCVYESDCVFPYLETASHWLNISLELLLTLPFVLNKTELKSFSVNSTGYDIISRLSIQEWNENINYKSYYKTCNPSYCLYSITKRFDIATILTTMIGLIGGVSVILSIVIPSVVKLVRQKYLCRIRFEDFQKILQYIRQLNLYKMFDTNQSIAIRRNQIQSTRIYIFLWIVSVIFISIYTGLTQNIATITINSPTIFQIQQYQNKNLINFACPCSTPSISFGSFVSLNFTFHQICSSDFISTKWLEYLLIMGNKHLSSRGVFNSHFQLLRSFCYSSQKTLLDRKLNFYTNEFITMNLLNENEFFQQSQSYIDELQAKTRKSFVFNLKSIIDITLGNQLMSVYETSWSFIPSQPIHNASSFFYNQVQFYNNNNCSCGSPQASTCVDPLILNENTTVDGMMIGCLPLTSLRLSTLKCFYNQSCLNKILNSLNLSHISINILNSNESSQYSINTTLDRIIDNLMVEQSFSYINYTAYFYECNPSECTYLAYTRNSVLYVFSTLLGLYGGLTVVLKLIAMLIVKMIQNIYNRCYINRITVPQPF